MAQKEQILEHLKSGHSLTPLEALDRFGCLTLSQRCGELRREGQPVVSEMVKLPSGKRVCRYRLDTTP